MREDIRASEPGSTEHCEKRETFGGGTLPVLRGPGGPFQVCPPPGMMIQCWDPWCCGGINRGIRKGVHAVLGVELRTSCV